MRLELVSLYTFIRISVSSAVALEPHPDPTGLTDCASLPGELYINTVFGHFWKTYFNHTVKDFIDSGLYADYLLVIGNLLEPALLHNLITPPTQVS